MTFAALDALQPARVALVALAVQPSPTPLPTEPGGRGEDFGKSSPVGLVVIILFFIAVFFLVRSMNRHLRRVPESFEPPAEKPPEDRPDNPPRG